MCSAGVSTEPQLEITCCKTLFWSTTDFAVGFLNTFSLPMSALRLLKQFYSAIIESVLCTSITVWFSSATKSDLNLSKSLVHPSTLSKNCTYPEWAKGLAKSLWTPHIQHTSSLNCYRLVNATELWAPERPDTETVSSLRQSISWTLDNDCGTHTIYTLIHLFIQHTYLEQKQHL